jgi:hypothetical protein
MVTKKKKKKVFKKDVLMYKRGCRDAHDEEGAAICADWIRLKKLEKFVDHLHDCNVMSCIPTTLEGCTCGLLQAQGKS